ncbi:MAG TPA: PEPxxWA-CTERM sorting domain-containing protein [Phenylobacterium sp.]
MLATAAALALAAGSAHAAVVSFANFDDLGGGPGPSFFDVATADGWTAGVGTIEIQHNNVAGNAFSQPNLVELDSNGNSSMFFTLAAGTYTVDWYYSPRPGVAGASNGIDLSIGSSLLDSIALSGVGNGDTVWGHRSVTFKTGGGALTFASTGASDSLGGYLDNITISTGGVPEPAGWALMIAGFGLSGGMLRRRARTAAA